MNLRKATPNDALLLSGLARDVQNLHAQSHPDVFKMPDSDDFAISFFEEMLVDAAVAVFIAEEEGNALGYTLCRLIERPDTPFTFAARYLLVDQISVRPTARGQGAGAALIKQVEILARELDVKRIQLDSWEFNAGAHAFFERMGFQKFNFRFWRQL